MKRVVDANAQLGSIDSPLKVRVDVAALIGFRQQVRRQIARAIQAGEIQQVKHGEYKKL